MQSPNYAYDLRQQILCFRYLRRDTEDAEIVPSADNFDLGRGLPCPEHVSAFLISAVLVLSA